MLPAPSLSFTIPSIQDDTVLDCRIYLPASYTSISSSTADSTCPGRRRKKAAIVAHPYGPMGGSYDDPVVDLVAGSILKQDFVVGTFNFRGAGTSKGRTSWTAKPETSDYMSMVGFMVYFMHELQLDILTPLSSDDEGPHHSLSPIPSHALGELYISHEDEKQRLRLPQGVDESAMPRHILLMAGYSYGAMITTLLPSLPTILAHFSTPQLGTAASEIRLRAAQLASTQNEISAALALQSQAESSVGRSGRRGRSLQIDTPTSPRKMSSSQGVRMGGEESNPEHRRQSHEFNHRRSFDPGDSIRRSVDRVRSITRHSKRHDEHANLAPKRFSSYSSASGTPRRSIKARNSVASLEVTLAKTASDRSAMQEEKLEQLQASYLVISPLQGFVNNLATMWSVMPRTKAKAGESPEEEVKLFTNRTLAVYGDSDIFTSCKKLGTWAERLRKKENSHFQAEEISGAGHFWHEEGVAYMMRDFAKGFVKGL